MGEAADDLIDHMLAMEFADPIDYLDKGDPRYDDWVSISRHHYGLTPNQIMAAHIKTGGASRDALKLGTALNTILDPYKGWEPL